MRNLTPLLFALLSYVPHISFAQCGTANEPQFITSQADLDALSGCEIFLGDLNIVGYEITNIDGLASLIAVNGNLNIYDTNITSIDSASLGGLTTANEINIYNNQDLSACCGALVWQDALYLGTISSVNFSSNASGCNSYFDAQATCLGEVPGCMNNTAVNYNWQATLDDGSCLNGIDLQVSVGTILNSLYVVETPSYDDCLVAEGCFTGTGTRKTLRFTTTISNYGNEDFIIGSIPDTLEGEENSQFYYDDCHNHYHYEGYANYQVFNYPNLSPSATIGHKNGWCVMDLGGAVSSENPGWNSPACSFTYGCSYMGISAGCSDTYSSGIDCQWVDITDLVDGEYVLAVSTNMETENYTPTPELDFSNNVVYVLFEIVTNDQGETSVVSASEFDGSAINDVCVLDGEATDLGFNFSEDVIVSDQQTLFPTAYLNEYYTQPVQFVLTENINLNGLDVSVDSLVIDSVSGLPSGVNLACSPQSCSFTTGNSCIGITGIPQITGSFNLSIESTLYLTDEAGNNQQIALPYSGGNEWLYGVLGDNDQAFDSFTPSININVEVPVYGCTDTLALNYSDTATFDDGSCELPNMGCTDPFSLNFNPEANFEDGSCEYCAEGIEWVVQMDLYDSYGDGWAGNNYYIINEWGDTSATGTLEDGSQGADLFCLAHGCYVISVPATGNYADDISWQLTSAGFPEVNVTGSYSDFKPFSFSTDSCEFIEGCTQSDACNYNSLANVSEADSCEYPPANFDCDGNQYACEDTDNGATDPYNDGCVEYSSNPVWCNGYDDSDFISSQMCCVCGGGDTYMLVPGCMNQYADNYDSLATQDDGSCVVTVILGCIDDEALNYDENASINDNSCCYVSGCTDPNALNYDSLACVDNASCIPYVLGCSDSLSENYNPLANVSTFFTGPYDTELGSGGFHYNDAWDMVFNCYETVSIKSIDLYSESSFSTQIEILDANNTQIHLATISLEPGLNQVDLDFLIEPAENYKIGINGTNDGLYRNSSVANNMFPINLLNVIDITSNTTDNPLNYFYYFYNWQLEIACTNSVAGCTDETACNYNELANDDDGSCSFAELYYTCDGSCLNDADVDGVCDELEVQGCTDTSACNYNTNATNDDGSCLYAEAYVDCSGNCLNDIDFDGICDELEVEGCTDASACNFYSDATNDDGSCLFAETYYDCDGNCLNDLNFNSICDELEIQGCTNMTACNYIPDATLDDGSCLFAEIYYDCDGNCLNDFDTDGECDEIDYDDGIGVNEVEQELPILVKMIDVLGRAQKEHHKGKLLFYLYNNGTVVKKIKH